MNYKLAKQLKDAGFPQIPKGRRILGFIIPLRCPTLSELIEACGERFGSFARNGAFRKYTPHNDEWEVWSANSDFCFSGKTPEEAVAKLWLELNK